MIISDVLGDLAKKCLSVGSPVNHQMNVVRDIISYSTNQLSPYFTWPYEAYWWMMVSYLWHKHWLKTPFFLTVFVAVNSDKQPIAECLNKKLPNSIIRHDNWLGCYPLQDTEHILAAGVNLRSIKLTKMSQGRIVTWDLPGNKIAARVSGSAWIVPR